MARLAARLRRRLRVAAATDGGAEVVGGVEAAAEEAEAAETAEEAAVAEEEAAAVELLAAAPEVAHEILDLISAEEMAHRMRGVAEPEAAWTRLQAALGRLRGLLATPAAYHVALLQRPGPRHAPADWSYGIWLMAPSALLGPVVATCRAVVLASATLAPLEAVAAELLGGCLGSPRATPPLHCAMVRRHVVDMDTQVSAD